MFRREQAPSVTLLVSRRTLSISDVLERPDRATTIDRALERQNDQVTLFRRPCITSTVQVGIKGIPKRVGHDIYAEHGDIDRKARNKHERPGCAEKLLCVLQHVAP